MVIGGRIADIKGEVDEVVCGDVLTGVVLIDRSAELLALRADAAAIEDSSGIDAASEAAVEAAGANNVSHCP